MEGLRRATQALHIPGMGHHDDRRGSSNPRAVQKRKTATEEQVDALKFPKKHKPVFVDAKAMKEKLRKNMHKKRYNVHDFYWETGFCQKIARHHTFENITLAVIGFNALWIAIDCDYNNAEVLFKAHPIFIFAENAFCLFFFIELSLRFGSFKKKYNCLKDAWFCFDTFMVAMMVLETWVMTIILLAIGGSGSSGLGNASLLRLLRLMRLSRMARMARLLRSCPELLILIKGMLAAIRSVFFTLMLLLIILYIFAILFRQLTADTEVGEEYFPGVLSAMNALTLDGILFDSAGDMTGLIIESGQQYLLPFFYCFVLLATLTVLNMLIGVLCEVINNVAICEHEELTIARVKENMEPIVAKYCTAITQKENEDTGEMEDQLNIGKPEFLEILQDADTPLLLREVKVDPFGLVDLVDTIFATEQGTERILDFGGFVEALMDQRETETATVKDVTELRKYIRGRIDRKEDGLEAYMNSLGNMVEKLTQQPQGTYLEEVQKAKKIIFKEKGINLGIDELDPAQKENQRQKENQSLNEKRQEQEPVKALLPEKAPVVADRLNKLDSEKGKSGETRPTKLDNNQRWPARRSECE